MAHRALMALAALAALLATASQAEEVASSVSGRFARASPLRWGKREVLRWGKRQPLRWGKRAQTSPLLDWEEEEDLEEADSGGDGTVGARMVRAAPLRWGKRSAEEAEPEAALSEVDEDGGRAVMMMRQLRASPLRWGKRAYGYDLGSSSSGEGKRAPLRWGKRAPSRFGKRAPSRFGKRSAHPHVYSLDSGDADDDLQRQQQDIFME